MDARLSPSSLRGQPTRQSRDLSSRTPGNVDRPSFPHGPQPKKVAGNLTLFNFGKFYPESCILSPGHTPSQRIRGILIRSRRPEFPHDSKQEI